MLFLRLVPLEADSIQWATKIIGLLLKPFLKTGRDPVWTFGKIAMLSPANGTIQGHLITTQRPSGPSG